MASYNNYSSNLISRYGYRIFRVGIDAGFSCPNRCNNASGYGCVYCDSQGARAAYLRTSESSFRHDSDFEEAIDQKIGVFSIDEISIKAQVERGLEFLKRRYKAEHFAAYLQSFSNTFAPYEKLKKLYDYVLSLYNWDCLIISTRPDCIDEQKLSLLESYKANNIDVCIELGLQSGDDNLLKKMNRGHSVKCFLESAQLVKMHNLELCMHVLTGFPTEKQKELDKTIEAICKVHPNALKIHNLNIASGTILYNEYLQGEITAPCMSRHIENVIYILRRIPSDIVIERLICETPKHRLASPRLFPDKNKFLRALEEKMQKNGFLQGDLWQK